MRVKEGGKGGREGERESRLIMCEALFSPFQLLLTIYWNVLRFMD